MPTHRQFTVEATYIGDPDTGLWCPDCALPSGYGLLLALHTHAGMPVGWGYLTACTDCGRKGLA